MFRSSETHYHHRRTCWPSNFVWSRHWVVNDPKTKFGGSGDRAAVVVSDSLRFSNDRTNNIHATGSPLPSGSVSGSPGHKRLSHVSCAPVPANSKHQSTDPPPRMDEWINAYGMNKCNGMRGPLIVTLSICYSGYRLADAIVKVTLLSVS